VVLARDCDALTEALNTCGLAVIVGSGGAADDRGTAENVGFASKDELADELRRFEKWYARCHVRAQSIEETIKCSTGAGVRRTSTSWERGGVCDTDAARRVITATCAAPVLSALFFNTHMYGDSSGKSVRCVIALFARCL
jgi:hypothetical protein